MSATLVVPAPLTSDDLFDLLSPGTLVLEPLTYIRGRSIPNQFMIVDEAQNLTPHEVKTIASRVGSWISTICHGSPVRRSLCAPSMTPSSDVTLCGSFVPQPSTSLSTEEK